MNGFTLKPLVKREKPKKKTKKSLQVWEYFKKRYSHQTLFRCILAFLLSGTKLIGGASPLGFSFFVASFESKDALLCMIFSVLGLIFRGSGFITVGKYIIAAVIFSLIYERIVSKRPRAREQSAILALLSLLSSGLFILFSTMSFGGYPLIYDLVVLIVECATLWLGVRAFLIASPLLFSPTFRRTLTTEETVSLSLLVGGAICGFGSAGLGGIFSLSGILCVLFVLAFATSFGPLHGSAAGIVMGIISCLSRGRIDACAASFAFSGLCAGFFSKYGRWASCVSFIISNAVITILSNGSTEVLINISDTLIAASILYLMPKKIYDAVKNIGSHTHPNTKASSSVVKFTAGAIEKLEKDFKSISSIRQSEISSKMIMYHRTAKRTCLGCGLRKYCWGRDSTQTKESIDNLSLKIENGEALTPQDAPVHCLRAEQFIGDFRAMHDIYKNDLIWTSRIYEYQNCIFSALGSISKMVSLTADNISKIDDCDFVASDEIAYRLKKEGINPKGVYVSGSGDEMQIRITLESCGGFGRCENAVCKVLDSSIGKSFVRCGLRSCGECSHTYVVKPDFSITSAIAHAVKENKKHSGDYSVYALLDRHNYAIVLCDGMGSGKMARKESKACASLLIRLLEAHLPPQEALSMINSMLLFSSNGSIAAIDLCIINLDDGKSKFYKRGGADTFAKCGDTVTHIDARTLPIGATNTLETNVFEVNSTRGSMIVLVSDGATALSESACPQIKNTISEFDGKEPEVLAQRILAVTKKLGKNANPDDITIVASYIE